MKILTRKEEAAIKAEAWNNYLVTQKQNEERVGEVYADLMYYDEATKTHTYNDKNAIAMRYSLTRKGLPGENGYPVYIFLHGGGQWIGNEKQYEHAKEYLLDSIENGLYIACRGIRETYNTHFNPESYPLYDRLIQNLILFRNADPNRIYLTGFSAGGDGVYGITPIMADRFAAVSMSAGHHNQISAINYMNTPIVLQCGDDDTPYDRHLETARYGVKLSELQAKWPGNYTHECYMHVKKQHQIDVKNPYRSKQVVWEDSVKWLNGESNATAINTNIVDWVSQFTRNPLPKSIAWNLENRAPLRHTHSFYWLKADISMDKGVIYATWDKDTNTATITTQDVSSNFYILLNWDMADFDRPISLIVNGKTQTVTATPSKDIIEETTKDRGDANYQFSAMVEVKL